MGDPCCWSDGVELVDSLGMVGRVLFSVELRSRLFLGR